MSVDDDDAMVIRENEWLAGIVSIEWSREGKAVMMIRIPETRQPSRIYTKSVSQRNQATYFATPILFAVWPFTLAYLLHPRA